MVESNVVKEQICQGWVGTQRDGKDERHLHVAEIGMATGKRHYRNLSGHWNEIIGSMQGQQSTQVQQISRFLPVHPFPPELQTLSQLLPYQDNTGIRK